VTPRAGRARVLWFVTLLAGVAFSAQAAPPAAVSRAAAAARDARTWRKAHERPILDEFVRFLAIPNVAGDRAGIERNAEMLRGMLEKRGLMVRVLRQGDAPPIVVGDLAGARGARTVAFYAHYDGQPTDTLSWRGLPWTPVLRSAAGVELPLPTDTELPRSGSSDPIDPEARLYARSAGDDKAPIIAMLAALDALRAAKRAPAFHLRLVFEGEEEAGSPHLVRYMAAEPALLRPDAWLICDGPVHQSGRPLLAFGARGTTSVDLTVYGPVKGLHDGHYGNWVPNPASRLAHLLASLRDEQGGSTIPGFLDEVVPPTDAERAAVAAIPPVEPELRAEFEIGGVEGGGAPLNETLLRPAINIRGLRAGNVGERASNTIATEARASIDFRLVPAQTPASVRAHLEEHLASLGWTVVSDPPDSALRVAHDRLVRLEWGPGYPAARTPLDAPFSSEVTRLVSALGREPVRTPTLGGSVPMYLFRQPDPPGAPAGAHTPVIILPIANHDDNQHAPNENLRLQNLWDGIETFAALFAGLGM
jgi:acetylornithine deacetylase/succinyl-diaminopimelate desuccinylase-like protein